VFVKTQAGTDCLHSHLVVLKIWFANPFMGIQHFSGDSPEKMRNYELSCIDIILRKHIAWNYFICLFQKNFVILIFSFIFIVETHTHIYITSRIKLICEKPYKGLTAWRCTRYILFIG